MAGSSNKSLEFELSGFGKRISLEMGTELQVEFMDVTIPTYSALVGMEGDLYMVVKSPAPYNLVKQKIYTGNELIIKYLFGGTVYAFQTKIIDAISKPFKLLFLEYPKIIEKHELRSFKRAKCFFPAKLLFDQKECPALVVDISRRGCKCQVKVLPGEKYPAFRIDETLHLFSKFPGIEGDVKIGGTIRNLKKNKQEIVLGIGFSKTNPESIQQLINQYMLAIYEDY
jgi:hypothetical protein